MTRDIRTVGLLFLLPCRNIPPDDASHLIHCGAVMEDYDYSFSQNGLVAYKAGELIGEQVRLAMSSCVPCT